MRSTSAAQTTFPSVSWKCPVSEKATNWFVKCWVTPRSTQLAHQALMQKAKKKQQHIYQKGFTSKGRTPWKKFCVHCISPYKHILGVVLVILRWSLQTQLCPILPCHYEGGDLMQTRVSALLQISTIPHVQLINKWVVV